MGEKLSKSFSTVTIKGKNHGRMILFGQRYCCSLIIISTARIYLGSPLRDYRRTDYIHVYFFHLGWYDKTVIIISCFRRKNKKFFPRENNTYFSLKQALETCAISPAANHV